MNQISSILNEGLPQTDERPIFGFDPMVGIGKTESGIQSIHQIISKGKDETGKLNARIKGCISDEDALLQEVLKNQRKELRRMARTIFAVPSHKLGDELVARIEGSGLSAGAWRGRMAENPMTEDLMCLKPKEVERVIEAGLPVEGTLCSRKINEKEYTCEHYSGCPYQLQKAELRHKDVVVVPHASLFFEMPAINSRGVTFIDEGFWQSSLMKDAGHENVIMSLGVFRDADTAFPNHKWYEEHEQSDLAEMRKKVADALEAHHHGHIRRNHMAGVLNNSARYVEARHYEGKTIVRPSTYPGMPPDEFRNALKQAHANKGATRRIHLWKVLEELLSNPEIERSGLIVRTEDKDGNPAVELRKREDIKVGWADGSVVILDATLSPELVQPYFDRPLIFQQSQQVICEHVSVLQTVDKSFSASYLIPNDGLPEDERNRRCNRAREVWRWVCLRAIEYSDQGKDGIDVLVICQQGLEAILVELGLPGNVDIAHFKAIRGLDKWGGVRCLIVVGRTIPSPSVIEEITETVSGIAVNEKVSDEWYPQQSVGIRLTDGTGWPVDNDRHPDPLAEAVRYQICEAELEQAIGRGRAVNRTAETPLQIDILTDVCLPLVVDEPVRWKEVAPDKIEEMICHGLVTSSHSVAARLYPDLWKSADALKKAVERKRVAQAEGGKKGHSPIINYIWGMSRFTSPARLFVSGLCKLSSDNKRATVFPFAFTPFLIPDAQEWLEERLGPVDWVLMGDEAEAEFAKRQKTSARKKHEKRQRLSGTAT
jgi:putative DNA primase/helicase